MLPQQTLETAAWSASGQSTIRLNRLQREIDGGRAHLVGLSFKLDLTITAGGAGTDTYGTYMIRAVDELRITDALNQELVKWKGHIFRTGLKMLTGRRCGGFADPADVPSAGGAGVARTVRWFLPFVGESGPMACGLLGLRKWTDALQPVDRFLGDNALITVNWGTATPFNAGTLTAATLTVTPIMVSLPELHQGCDIRLGYQTNAAGSRFDLTLKGAKLLMAGLVNPDLDHIDYTALDLRHGLLVKASPVERCQAFNVLCVRDQAEFISATAPDCVPVVFAAPGMGITKLQGFGYPATLALETTTTHATEQTMAYAELMDRGQLVNNCKASGLGDYARVAVQQPKYETKNAEGVRGRKGQVFDAIGPAKLKRQRAA